MKFSWSVNPRVANRTKPNKSIAPNPPKKDRKGRARERVSLSRNRSFFRLNTSKNTNWRYKIGESYHDSWVIRWEHVFMTCRSDLVSKIILLVRKGPGTLLIPGWSVRSVNGNKIWKLCLFVCLLAFFRSIFFLLGRFSFCFLLLVLYLSIVMFCTQVFIIVFD